MASESRDRRRLGHRSIDAVVGVLADLSLMSMKEGISEPKSQQTPVMQ